MGHYPGLLAICTALVLEIGSPGTVAPAAEPGPSAVPGLDPWRAAFVDETLRLDYHHGGAAAPTTEFAAWDGAVRGGPWAGSRTQLVDPRPVGRSRVEVADDATGALLWARRCDTYFGEYRTTTPALGGAVRVYHESALIPRPLRPVRIRLSVRSADGTDRTLLDHRLDPNDPASVRTEPPLPEVVITPTHEGGETHRVVDVAIVGEGYTRADEAKWRADLSRFTAVLLRAEPYRSRRERFNVRGVWLPSLESGADEPARGVWRATSHGVRFDSLGSERYLLTEDNLSLRRVAGHVPYDALILLVNSPRYGGGGIYNLFCTATTDNEWSEYVLLHEFGHSFAGLADEYYSSNVAYNDFYPRGREPIEPNITALLDPTALKWADLATPGLPIPTPWPKAEFDAAETAFQQRREALNQAITRGVRDQSPATEVDRLRSELATATQDHARAVDERIQGSPLAGKVGAFEGAGYSTRGLYRPALDCIMFSRGSKPYCAVCRRALEQTIDHLGEPEPPRTESPIPPNRD